MSSSRRELPRDLPHQFSDGAEAQLRDALANYVSTWEDERHTVLRAALERLCTEAHERSLGPERMLVSVKAAWAAVTAGNRLNYEREQVIFSRLLDHCLDAYYSDPHQS